MFDYVYILAKGDSTCKHEDTEYFQGEHWCKCGHGYTFNDFAGRAAIEIIKLPPEEDDK